MGERGGRDGAGARVRRGAASRARARGDWPGREPGRGEGGGHGMRGGVRVGVGARRALQGASDRSRRGSRRDNTGWKPRKPPPQPPASPCRRSPPRTPRRSAPRRAATTATKPNVPASSSSTTSTSACVWSDADARSLGDACASLGDDGLLFPVSAVAAAASARCGVEEISEEKVLAHLAEAVRLFVKGGHLEAAVRAAKVALPAWERRRAFGDLARAHAGVAGIYRSLHQLPPPGAAGAGTFGMLPPPPGPPPSPATFYRVRLVGSAWGRDRENTTWVHREPRDRTLGDMLARLRGSLAEGLPEGTAPAPLPPSGDPGDDACLHIIAVEPVYDSKSTSAGSTEGGVGVAFPTCASFVYDVPFVPDDAPNRAAGPIEALRATRGVVEERVAWTVGFRVFARGWWWWRKRSRRCRRRRPPPRCFVARNRAPVAAAADAWEKLSKTHEQRDRRRRRRRRGVGRRRKRDRGGRCVGARCGDRSREASPPRSTGASPRCARRSSRGAARLAVQSPAPPGRKPPRKTPRVRKTPGFGKRPGLGKRPGVERADDAARRDGGGSGRARGRARVVPGDVRARGDARKRREVRNRRERVRRRIRGGCRTDPGDVREAIGGHSKGCREGDERCGETFRERGRGRGRG